MLLLLAFGAIETKRFELSVSGEPTVAKENAMKKPLIDKNGEAHELGSNFFNKARRGRPPLPENRQKQRVTLHLDPDLLEYFKRGGKGWQTRINAALQEYKGGQ